MSLFHHDTPDSTQEVVKQEAKKYSGELLGALGNLPPVSHDEIDKIKKTFFNESGKLGLSRDERLGHVENSIEVLTKTNPDLADFIKEYGSGEYSDNPRETAILALGAIALILSKQSK